MALIRIKNGIEDYTDPHLLTYARFVHEQMTGNTNFPTPTPSLTDLLAGITAFDAAVQAAGYGGKLLVQEKRDKKKTLVDLLHLLGYYVVYAAGGDATKAMSSGFPLVKPAVPLPEMPKPEGLQVSLGDQTGVMVVKVKKVKGAVAYNHQYTTDASLKEESWVTQTCSTAKCIFSNLTPGTTYYVRVGAIGGKGQVKFSDVISKVAG